MIPPYIVAWLAVLLFALPVALFSFYSLRYEAESQENAERLAAQRERRLAELAPLSNGRRAR